MKSLIKYLSITTLSWSVFTVIFTIIVIMYEFFGYTYGYFDGNGEIIGLIFLLLISGVILFIGLLISLWSLYQVNINTHQH